MICPACDYPILSRTDLGTDDEGRRVLGEYCTHCGRIAKLIEIVVRGPKDAMKQNRNT